MHLLPPGGLRSPMSNQPFGYQYITDACDLLLSPLTRPGRTGSARFVAGEQPEAYRTWVLHPQALWPRIVVEVIYC